MVVGAYLDDDKGGASGSAYVFEKNENDNDFTQLPKLTASDGSANDYFGYSVAVSDITVVVGAYLDDGSRGSAYVYQKNNGTYAQLAKLTASDGAANDQFGRSVAVSGNIVVVGAWGVDGSRGSAYVYQNNNGTYAQLAELTSSDGASGDYFGYSVAISGNIVVVGAWGVDGSRGSAYVYQNNNGTYAQLAELTSSDGAAGDQFGYSVAISGNIVVVGAYGDDGSRGSAYVFEKNGTPLAKLTASDGTAYDRFGASVSVSGNIVVVGAPGDDDYGSESGSAYIYKYS